MVSGNATRPGDIVTSMSGQTIEILNTDAEGRLVLADVLWYAQERYKPKLIVDLATLTGAIMIALGKEYAGLFVNDERLAGDLLSASKATGEKLWRMPLDKAFHRMIDCKTADMKNIGGRWAGSCTAARSWSASSRTRRGRISMSPAPRWIRDARTSTPAGARAGACGCSTGSSPTITRRADRSGRGLAACKPPVGVSRLTICL